MSLPAAAFALEHPRVPLDTLELALAELDRAAARAPESTASRAMAAGFASDRVAYAVLGGYDAALHRLLAPRAIPRASFCVTEAGGVHPRSMETRIDERDGRHYLTGKKSFATLAERADVYVVIAQSGETEGGHKVLRAALLERGAPGLVLVPRPPLPFAPEIPHAALELTDTPAAELLEGDAYERYVKPFRTVEDAHVTLAVTAYALAEARRFGWNEGALLASLASLSPLAAESDPSSPTTHLALDVELDRARAALDALPWHSAPADVSTRWFRDRPVLEVASRAREKRTTRARERLT